MICCFLWIFIYLTWLPSMALRFKAFTTVLDLVVNTFHKILRESIENSYTLHGRVNSIFLFEFIKSKIKFILYYGGDHENLYVTNSIYKDYLLCQDYRLKYNGFVMKKHHKWTKITFVWQYLKMHENIWKCMGIFENAWEFENDSFIQWTVIYVLMMIGVDITVCHLHAMQQTKQKRRNEQK